MRPNARTLALALPSMFGICGMLACACGEDSAANHADASAGSDAGGLGGFGGHGANGGSGGAAPDAAPDAPKPCTPTTFVPPQVPAGWEPYQDFSCTMPFWVPSSPSALPEPIVWEKCNQYAPEGIECRTMALNWPHDLSPVTAAVVQAESGNPIRMLFKRNTIGKGLNTWEMFLLADADGPVHMAIGQTYQLTEGLRTKPAGLHRDHFAILARGGVKSEHADDSDTQGVMVGTVGELRPKLFRKEVIQSTLDWLITPQYVIRLSALEQNVLLYPRNGVGEPLLFVSSATDPDGLQISEPVPNGADLFVDMNSLSRDGIMAYDPATGTVPLIRWVGDTTQGAYNVGTDGQHLVWTYGKKPADTQGVYPERSIMVSPYTTDPKQIVATRLRSDPEQAADRNFAVGCGYAAHSAGSAVGFIVVRLSDGWSWRVYDNGNNWQWWRVKAITCDEVFLDVSAWYDSESDWVVNLARVRLDSLGAGEAPD
jgi:hypothetical protein